MRPAALRAAKPDLELDIFCWAGGKHNPRARRMEQKQGTVEARFVHRALPPWFGVFFCY